MVMWPLQKEKSSKLLVLIKMNFCNSKLGKKKKHLYITFFDQSLEASLSFTFKVNACLISLNCHTIVMLQYFNYSFERKNQRSSLYSFCIAESTFYVFLYSMYIMYSYKIVYVLVFLCTNIVIVFYQQFGLLFYVFVHVCVWETARICGYMNMSFVCVCV